MKKTVLMTAILMTLSVPAMAEQQIYSRNGQPMNYARQNVYGSQQQAAAQPSYQPNTYMVYPGREHYGQGFGPIPRHPGDYRDAVTRGSWGAGGGGAVGARSFDIR